jgi:hypothetical protein
VHRADGWQAVLASALRPAAFARRSCTTLGRTMNYGDKVLNDMAALIQLFYDRCSDRSTLTELQGMIGNYRSWGQAHDLFDRIRGKTLKAERSGGDEILVHQYLFEEICAKTLYNLSGERAPFDADSPYWILPNAIAFARIIGIHESKVIEIIAA